MRDLKEILSPRDRSILDAQTGTSWVPRDPREVLLPYIVKDPATEDNDVDSRQKKAKEIYDGYGKLIQTCEELKKDIAKRCKNVVATLNPQQHLNIMDAVKRIFGTDGTQITFQMYQKCVQEMAKQADDSIPKPGEQ